MRRLALLGAACTALVIGAAACGDTPVQPRGVAGSALAPSFTTSSTSLACENAVVPSSLCSPYIYGTNPPQLGQRSLLCKALYEGTPVFYHPVSGVPAKETFTPNPTTGGATEEVQLDRPYSRPKYFIISQAQKYEICKNNQPPNY
jgi:hypothetical protein